MSIQGIRDYLDKMAGELAKITSDVNDLNTNMDDDDLDRAKSHIMDIIEGIQNQIDAIKLAVGPGDDIPGPN